MTEDQVFMEFLQNFGDTNKDGTLTRQEWNEYYAAVSSSIDNDDHFVQLMNTAWKLWWVYLEINLKQYYSIILSNSRLLSLVMTPISEFQPIG